MNTKQIIINLAILGVTIIAINLFLPKTAHIFLPKTAHIGNKHHSAAEQTIVIIPMAGIPIAFLTKLEKKLEKQHKTDVQVTTALGKGDEMLIPNKDQYNANYLAALGLEIGNRIQREGAFFIVLTNEDINYPDSGFRYVYSAHYEGISVASLARINYMNFGVTPRIIQIPEMFTKMQERALKIVNKAIGYGVYGYEASSNIGSVMYGPIMGPDDLDRVGNWY